MKLTIEQLKQLIKEQVEEAQELAKAYKAAGSPAPKPAKSQIDTSAGIRSKMDDLANQSTRPQQPALEEEVEESSKGGYPANKPPKKSWAETERARAYEAEHKNSKAKYKKEDEEGWERAKKYGRQPEGELEEQIETLSTVQENIRKMVREAIEQLAEKKKGLPPWLKPGFKKDEDKASKKETEEPNTEKSKTCSRCGTGKPTHAGKLCKDCATDPDFEKENLDEARLLELIKEAIKQNLNEKDSKWLSKAGKEISKKGTKGALHKDLDVAKGKKIPTATLAKKKAALQKKSEGDKKMSSEDRKELQRVQFALNAKKAKK